MNEEVIKKNILSFVSTHKEAIGKNIINGFLLFIVFSMLGCMDFATLEFHFEYLLQASYWLTVLVKAIAGILAFNIGINLMWDSEIKKNLELTENMKRYDELKTQKQNDFEYYVNKIFNPTEKKIAYISQINRKIYLLNKFSRAKDRLLYSSELKERQEEKKRNLYCIKRKELEELKSEEFINKNIDSLKVKYYEVDATVFELEVDGSPALRGVKTRGNATIGRVKATSTMVLGMIMCSMLLTAIGLEIDKMLLEESLHRFLYFFLKIVADVGVILWQLFRGTLKTRKIISSELTQPYAGRVKVLTCYLEWRLKENIPNTLLYESEHKENDIIEISEEELKKLQEVN